MQPPRNSHPDNPPASDPSLPATIDMDKLSMGEAFSSLGRLFQYTPGLPERIRNVGTYASGLFRDSANWLVPAAFRNSRSYSIFARQMLEYVTSSAEVHENQQPSTEGTRQADRRSSAKPNDEEVYLARKTVSSLLDMAALATFHVSPLTVMAIFGEVAYGWRGYVQQLGMRLKEEHIISSSTTIDDTTQLVAALRKAVGTTSAIFDKPLISIEGLQRTILETRNVVAETDAGKLLPLAEIVQLQRQMELAARTENASIWDVSATISVVALNHMQASESSGLVTLDIPGNIYQHHIIDHYWEGLRAIERHGLLNALSQASAPFLETLWTNYAVDQKSWTEQLLSRELLKWGWSRLTWPKLTRNN